MAGKSDIKAGSAFVELFVKGAKFEVGLNKMAAKLKSFGESATAIGTKMVAAGAAITAPLIGAVSHFAEAGSAVADMAARTGLSTEAISELGFAAQQTGSDMATLETGVRKMQQTIAKAASGNEAAAKSLAEFGVSAESLIGLSPDKQLEAIAAGLASIEDPAKRTAAAMGVFGKSGTSLIPMLTDMTALREEARRLGFTMSTETAESADKLGDAIDIVKSSIGALAIKIGGALAPTVTNLAEQATEIIARITEWVAKNGELVTFVAMLGTAIAAAGAGVMAFGVTVTTVGAALSGMAAIVGGLVSGIALLLTPVGAITAAFAAFSAAIIYSTGLVPKLIDALKPLVGAVKAIAAALMEGDFKKAWDIAATSVKYFGSVALDIFTSLPEYAAYAAGAVARAIIEGFKVAWEWVKSMPSMIDAMLFGDASIGETIDAAMKAAAAKLKSIGAAAAAGFAGEAMPGMGESDRTKALRDRLRELTGDGGAFDAAAQSRQGKGKDASAAARRAAAIPGKGKFGDGPVTTTFSASALIAQAGGGKSGKPEDKIVAALKAALVEEKKMSKFLGELLDKARDGKLVFG